MDMDRYSESFRAGMREKGVEIGVTRIGVNTGLVTVGNFGGELMFDYTAHGDAINTAARLESANKFFGTRIAVSENTSRLVGDFVGRPIGKLVLKGRSSGLKTFEPLSRNDYDSDRIQAYLDAYTAIVDGGLSAVKKFQTLVKSYPDDPLARFHMLRLEAGENGEVVILAGK
jgi:adenylate cyclase